MRNHEAGSAQSGRALPLVLVSCGIVLQFLGLADLTQP